MRVTRSQLRKLIAETIFLEQADNRDPYNDARTFASIVRPIIGDLGMKYDIVVEKEHYYIFSIDNINNVKTKEMLEEEMGRGKFVIGMPISAGDLGPFVKPFSGQHIAVILTDKNNQGLKFKSVNGFVVLD